MDRGGSRLSQRGPGVALLVALLLAPTLAAGEVDHGPLVPLAGSVPPFVGLAHDVGPADPRAPMTLAIDLVGESEPVLAWASTFGAATLSSDGSLLTLDTSVGAAAGALRIALREYALGDITLRSHAHPPLVPAALAPSIRAIVGLTDAPLTTYLSPGDEAPFDPAQLRAAYDVDGVHAAGFDGAGLTLAITGWGAADATALAEHSAAYALPVVVPTHVNASGGDRCPAIHLEWDLDVQMLHAMAPGADLRVYCGAAPSISAMLAVLTRLVADDAVDVVSQSWGTCELFVDAATAGAFEARFAAASAQGIAVFTASGDGGSRECTRASPGSTTVAAAWPATAPHTTSVGATALTLEDGAYAGETAWSSCAPCPGQAWGASGGAPSLLYPRPAWQPASVGAKRASPDISMVGDPATGVSVRSGDAWHQVGGTSASSPIAAGIWALAVDRHARLGNAGELLWQRAGNVTLLRDITEGANGDFAARAGYDFPTGLGSLRAAGLLDALARPGVPAVTARGTDVVTLSWDPPREGDAPVTGYRVYLGASATATSFRAEVPSPGYVDATLAPGGARWYQVAAMSALGEGERSAPIAARTYAASQPPYMLGARTDAADRTVVIDWRPPPNAALAGVTGYQVYRDGVLLETTVGAGMTSYFDDLCLLPDSCTYRITAVGVLGESAPSANASAEGTSVGVATPGQATEDPAGLTRLVGHEILALPLDADDALAGIATRDASLAQQHALVGDAVVVDGVHGAGLHGAVSVPPGAIAPGEGTLMLWARGTGTIVDAGDALQLSVESDGAVVLTMDGARLASPSGIVSDGAWHHVVVTWSASGRRVIVDGVAWAADHVASSPVPEGLVLVGGATAEVDEVRAYDAALPSGLAWDVGKRPYVAFPAL